MPSAIFFTFVRRGVLQYAPTTALNPLYVEINALRADSALQLQGCLPFFKPQWGYICPTPAVFGLALRRKIIECVAKFRQERNIGRKKHKNGLSSVGTIYS